MTKRMLSLLIMLGLLIVPTLGVTAQGTVYCSGLSDADCSQITLSQETMTNLNSASFVLNAGMSMNFPDATTTDGFSFQMIGDGALAMDFGALSGVTSASGDVTQTFDFITELVGGISGEASFEILVPSEISTAGMPELVFDLVMIEGVLYIDVGAFMGEETNGDPFWMGLDLAELYGEIGNEFATGLGGVDPFSMMNINAFADPAYIEQFVNMTRLADEQVRGSDTAVYQMSFDFGAMMQDETFLESMETYMTEFSDSFGMQGDMFSMEALAQIYQDVTYTITQWIGVNDNYVHRVALDMQMNVPGDAMGTGVGSFGDISMGMNFDIELFNFNEPINVVAPENAQILPTSMFTQGF